VKGFNIVISSLNSLGTIRVKIPTRVSFFLSFFKKHGKPIPKFIRKENVKNKNINRNTRLDDTAFSNRFSLLTVITTNDKMLLI
jgi:hypothetical protein